MAMADRSDDPWNGATYNGFSAPSHDEPPAADGRPLGRLRRVPARLVGAGLATAVALGLAFGLWTRGDLDDTDTSDRPMAAVTTSPAVPVEVAAVQPPTPPPSSGPLEVLPPDMARAAAANAARLPAQPSPQRVPDAETAAAPASAHAPEPRVEPGFDCGGAASRAERMVCADAELARLDRRLNGAFNEAVAAGVPRRSLRLDQDDWLQAREDAARQAGPEAVASVYRQRIAELRELARDAAAY